MLGVLFWILFLYLALEDSVYKEIDSFLFLFLLLIFILYYSIIYFLIGLFFYFLLRKSPYVGEADLFLFPMSYFLADNKLIFFISFYVFILFFMDLKRKITGCLIPMFLSVLISKLII